MNTNEQIERLAYRVDEFASAIGVSRSKAYEMIASGAVPSVRLGGGCVRVPVAALRAWIAKQVTGEQQA